MSAWAWASLRARSALSTATAASASLLNCSASLLLESACAASRSLMADAARASASSRSACKRASSAAVRDAVGLGPLMGFRLGPLELCDALGQRRGLVLRSLLGGKGSISRRFGLKPRAPLFGALGLGLLDRLVSLWGDGGGDRGDRAPP